MNNFRTAFFRFYFYVISAICNRIGNLYADARSAPNSKEKLSSISGGSALMR